MKKPHALLVNPWICDFAAYDFWMKPLGLLELGSALRTAGYEISLIDCLDLFYPGRTTSFPRRRPDGSGKFDQTIIPKPSVLAGVPRRFKRYGMPAPAFVSRLRSLPPPQVIFVSSVMTYWYWGVAETIQEIQRVFPRVPIILGGVYVSLLPEHAKEKSGADFIAEGDFRQSVPPLLRSLNLPANFPERDFFPAWDLYPNLLSAAIITGRGCSRRCPYCAVPVLHPWLSRREPEVVVAEVERLVKDYGVRDIAFFDDALRAGGDEHLLAILEEVVRRGLSLRFHAINALHLRGLSRELADLLFRANFATLRFGLETADPQRAHELGDKASLSDLNSAVHHLHAAGYDPAQIGVYLLAGLPGQSPAEVETSIREVKKSGARPILTEYSPVPGSQLWERAKTVARFDLSEPLFHNNTLLPCAQPEFTARELSRLKKLAREP